MSYRTPPVLGIDLGTTNTVAAAHTGDGVVIVRGQDGANLIPSVVAFTPNGDTLVGDEARLRRIIDAPNTIHSSKRIIGQSFRSPEVQSVISTLPYRVIEGNDQEPLVQTRNGINTLPQIASLVLGHVSHQTERRTGTAIRQCVVTVPANFGEGQRQATKRAAELAGLEVLRILNEPTAAAVAYGHQSAREERIAVFDMGGGTFDLTVLAVRDDLFEVIATGGDPFLGGDDMDRALAEHLAADFLVSERVDLLTIPEAYARLILVAEDIKRRLTETELVEDSVRTVAHGEGGRALDLDLKVSRDRFEHLVGPLVDRALDCAAGVLREAGLSPGQLDSVIMVGGATRVPLVARRLQERFGLSPRVDINPLEVVGLGAAMQAVQLVKPATAVDRGPLLVDVTSHALGIATTAGYVEHIVAKNVPIPAEGRKVFATAKDGQTTVRLQVCQGASRKFSANSTVGELWLTELRAAQRGEVRVEVCFLIDADGVLSVSARDLETGRAEHVTLRLVGVGADSAEAEPPVSAPELPAPPE